MRQADVVLISDYDKGVCTPDVLAAIIARRGRCGIHVAGRPRFAAAIIANTTAARPSRPTVWKPAWPPAAC